MVLSSQMALLELGGVSDTKDTTVFFEPEVVAHHCSSCLLGYNPSFWLSGRQFAHYNWSYLLGRLRR